MASVPVELTPQERLAGTRKAIVRHMNRHHRDGDEKFDSHADEATGTAPGIVLEHRSLSRIRHVARMWWHRHPASAALELASPLLDDYARAHPFKLLGISVATGAAFVLVKPWRLISASTLLIAAIKSSGLSNTLVTMMSSFTSPSGKSDGTP